MNAWREPEKNPIYLIDFYKFGHVDQYPKGIKRIVVNFTPRSTRVVGETGVYFFGLQRFIKKVLIDQFEEHFFNADIDDILRDYRDIMAATLGVKDPRTDHIVKLWEHGSLPLNIWAVPEGTHVPFGVPAMVVMNTEDWAFWLPNYLETAMSNNLWLSSTSASTAVRYRKIFEEQAHAAFSNYAKPEDKTFDTSFIDWQGHDFSYRGMGGYEAAVLSGMGHLLSFSGTDTLPAILEAAKYYNAPYSIGGSVPATEHSVMCAGSKDGELETFRRLIEDVYPSGVVSIVSDTWDLWKVCTELIPALKDKILARDGKVVIRPDSGDPVKILIGDHSAAVSGGIEPWGPDKRYVQPPAFYGALMLLAPAVGTVHTPMGLMLNKVGLIYGDSITPERAKAILDGARALGFSPYNFVFGIGSYTYQYVTRDTYNFAFKATAILRSQIPHREDPDQTDYDVWEAIFKAPVTDTFGKKSHQNGIPIAMWHESGEGLVCVQSLNPNDLAHEDSAFQLVFDGALQIDEDFATIRQRVRDWSKQ